MNKPGVILKITVTNFVTYTYAEMHPGLHLNMIVGPNGTGKSTMVAAIILGLGGNPKIVGRGSKVSEYVKHNFQSARIDIVLKSNNTKSNTVTITREFDLQEKSVWRIDGKKVSQKDLLDYVKLYNIQVDNLCQFLPQDRVQDFAKMNKQELLKQTKKALCREDLIERQQNLSTKRGRHIAVLENFNKHTKKLQEAKDANARLEGKVKNFNKRKKFLGLIKNIDRKIAWRKYEQIIDRRDDIKADKQRATEILQTHRKSAEPIEAAIRNAKKTVMKLRDKLVQDRNNLQKIETDIQNHNDKFKRSKDSIQELKSEMQAKFAEISQREEDIRTANLKLAKLQSDKEDLVKSFGADQDVETKVRRYTDEIRKISNQIGVIDAKKSEQQVLKRDKMYEIRALENELRKIENVKHQRLEYLRRLDADAYKATLWIRENSQNFRGQVFEPMILELNVINPDNAIYIENTVAIRDRVAFTCTDKEDMNSLIRLFRDEQKLRVNIVYSNPQDTIQMFQPRIPIERLRGYGLYAYLLSLFSAPAPITTYLCKNYRIHSVPVGNEKTNQCYEEIPQEIPCFFSDKCRFFCNYSKYTGEKLVRQNEIKSDGSLSISVDLAKLENIQGQLNDCRRSCEQFDDQIQELQNRITQLNETKERLSENLKQIRSISQNVQTIDSRIRMVKNNIQQLSKETKTEDDIRNETNAQIKQVIKQMLTLQGTIQEKFSNYSTLYCDMGVRELNMNVSEKHITFLENKAYDIRHLCEEAENTLQTIKRSYDEITKEAKQALQKGKDLSNGCTPDQEGFDEFREDYDKLSDELHDLERDKSEFIGKMECLTTADDDEMRDYEQRLELIERMEDALRNDNAEIETINRKMGKMEAEYLALLQELVDQISSRFSAAFEKMGCAGDVSIYKGENPQDYEQYGLSIKVTYRNGEPLQELNTVTQSGGERAVATATYMLSLQELTPVPFRCVDEINQGMDEINERRIFELLFNSTSQPNTAQYFLITPKLISNLNYPPSIKIHFIHNGPFVVSQVDWNQAKVQ